MDDIVIGASTALDAAEKLSRVQRALEPLGLYPNTAKTRIIPADEFTSDYMKPENDYLGQVEVRVKAKQPVDMVEFNRRIDAHLSMRNPVPKAWERVLRRIYTLSRHTQSRHLLRKAANHIKSYPGSASGILEYLRNFPLTEARFTALRQLHDDWHGIYEDVAILIQEFLATAPNSGGPKGITLCETIASWALDVATKSHATQPALAAAACVTVGKLGGNQELDRLNAVFEGTFLQDSLPRRQTAVILLGTGHVRVSEIRTLPNLISPESQNLTRFCEALATGDRPAAGVARGLIDPSARGIPRRPLFRPRALFLVPAYSCGISSDAETAKAAWLKKAQSAPRTFRDAAAIRWLKRAPSVP